MRTDDLIVQLAQDVAPVRPLAAPPARAARWAGRALLATIVTVVIVGPRPGALALFARPVFAGLEAAILVMALLAATCALVLSVPGAERTPLQRAVPFAAAGAWIALLAALLQWGGHAAARLLALPVHALCVIEIAALAVIPGWSLFGMLRRAAPLRRGWTAALATLAAVGFGAAGTQLLCPIDDPAHQLAGHAAPVAIFTVVGAIAFQRSLDWMRDRRPRSA